MDKIMETKFKIVKFTKNDNSFLKDGYDEYSITYLKGTKVHQLRIVVDGYLTKQSINIIDGNSGYKNKMLLGIKEYLRYLYINLKNMSKSNEMRKLIDDFKKFIIKENRYLGSCVEVGDDNSCNYINDIFSDATEMAYYVGDPDNDDFGQSE